MKRAKFLILAVFVSPEFLIALVAFGMYAVYPEILHAIGEKIKSEKEVWKYLPTLTLGFSALAFKQSSKLRAPLDNSSNKALYEWPLYQLLVDRVMVSLIFALACGVISLSLWIFGNSWSSESVGAVFVGATGAAASTALLMLLAHQKLRELMEKYGE